MKKHKYKLIIEYCGTDYHGMQKQTGLKTVEGQLIGAMNKMFPRDNIEEINYGGRTDTGVHATGQVVDFDLQKEIEPYNIMSGLNYYLSNDKITIIDCDQVQEDFHSRFSAKQRIYVYKVINRPVKLTFQQDRYLHCRYKLNLDLMKEQAKQFRGKHNFSSFCSSENQSNPVRTIDFIDIIMTDDGFNIYIGAKSFLHNMVRIIVGTLIDIGRGHINKSITEIIEAKNRSMAGLTVSPSGLYLIEIKY